MVRNPWNHQKMSGDAQICFLLSRYSDNLVNTVDFSCIIYVDDMDKEEIEDILLYQVQYFPNDLFNLTKAYFDGVVPKVTNIPAQNIPETTIPPTTTAPTTG